MIQKALEYIVGLKDNKTYQINGKTYSDKQLCLIEDEHYTRKNISFGSLDAIVKMLKFEIADYTDGTEPVFVHIKDHRSVDVFTRPNEREQRVWPYSAECSDTNFREGWRELDNTIIELRSRFIPTDDSNYLLSLISRINNEQGVRTEDNGVSQIVTAKQGVTLMGNEAVKPRLMLKPFRTFREIAQPESEFILRLDDGGRVGLFEADGGIWKMEAKDNIAVYFEKALGNEIEAGAVVVLT